MTLKYTYGVNAHKIKTVAIVSCQKNNGNSRYMKNYTVKKLSVSNTAIFTWIETL